MPKNAISGLVWLISSQNGLLQADVFDPHYLTIGGTLGFQICPLQTFSRANQRNWPIKDCFYIYPSISLGFTAPLKGGGRFPPPYQKMAITPKNNDPKEPKLYDFSYISMTNSPITFLGSKQHKRGSKVFLLLAVPIPGS